MSTAVLSSPAQLAASLSGLICFQPMESVVTIRTKSGVIEVTMRNDLLDD